MRFLLTLFTTKKYLDPQFQDLQGVRIVRIATNYKCQQMGYGSKALELYLKYLQQPKVILVRLILKKLEAKILSLKKIFAVDFVIFNSFLFLKIYFNFQKDGL